MLGTVAIRPEVVTPRFPVTTGHDYLPSRREEMLQLLADAGLLPELEAGGVNPLLDRLAELRRSWTKDQLEP